ncbi:hypothetical protein NL108_005907 [Boleophthalmus pectinirostris]|nr:hypothetical protein NL108_005907 [Boleophthalmus pectinirostris]
MKKKDNDSFFQFWILCLNEEWKKRITAVSCLRDCDARVLYHIRTEPGLIQVRDQSKTRPGLRSRPDRDQTETETRLEPDRDQTKTEIRTETGTIPRLRPERDQPGTRPGPERA